MYGAAQKPRISQQTSLAKGDTSNSYEITMSNHAGTHVDAPAHFIAGGRKIAEYPPEQLSFKRPVLLSLKKNAGEWIEQSDFERNIRSKSADCILVKTGFSKFRGKGDYCANNPGISPEAILWARANMPRLRCIGVDCISISGYQNRERGRAAHRAAFEEKRGVAQPLLIIEDMNLAPLSQKGLKRVFIFPVLGGEVDSSPCTVLAEVA
jgi:kynurenine formamidase